MPKLTVMTPSIRPEGLKILQDCLQQQTLQDFEWLVEIGLPARGPDLSRAYNRMLARATGGLVISYQDWIKIAPDGLQRLWEAYQENPLTFFTCPVVKTKANGSIVKDWRSYGDKRRINPSDWEADFGSAPLSALRTIGGWDEDYDQGWSWENVIVAEKAALIGCEFWVDPTNIATAVDHDELAPHPFRGQLENQELHAEKMRGIMEVKK